MIADDKKFIIAALSDVLNLDCLTEPPISCRQCLMKDVGVAAARTIQSQSESTSCHTRSVCRIDDASLACTDLSSQTTAAALNSAIMNAIRKISHEPQMRNHRFIFYE